jgi:hypothetical protein
VIADHLTVNGKTMGRAREAVSDGYVEWMKQLIDTGGHGGEPPQWWMRMPAQFASAAQKQRILSDNPAAMYGFAVPAAV